MEEISDLLNEHVSVCLPFIDDFYGFAQDVTASPRNESGKEYVFPVACNINVNECNESNYAYLLPESQKQGILFWDSLKQNGAEDLGCDVNYLALQFDLVVWINTNKVTLRNDICSPSEYLYLKILKCLMDFKNDKLAISGISKREDYMRTPWKFDERKKFLSEKYIAFRVPITAKYLLCLDSEPIEYDLIDC